jgi:hypothetical protein
MPMGCEEQIAFAATMQLAFLSAFQKNKNSEYFLEHVEAPVPAEKRP